MIVTFFDSQAAARAVQRDMTLADIAEMARSTRAAAKADLPWIKLAVFGDRRTPKGSLRHNANVTAITGIEADYDAMDMPMEDAAAILRGAGITALFYTSPSHLADLPRWRVVCPTSAPVGPELRASLTARVNALLGGVLARESFTLSQAYYIGHTGSASHTVLLVEGERTIDQAVGLPETYPIRLEPVAAPQVIHRPDAGPDERASDTLRSACDLLLGMTGGDTHPVLLRATYMVAPFILSGHLDEAETSTALADACATAVRPPNPGEMESALAGALAKATPYEPSTGGSEFDDGSAPVGPPPRPTIQIRADDLTGMVNLAEASLLASHELVYQRGGEVVRAGLARIRHPGGKSGVSLAVVPLGEVGLQEVLGRTAIWERWDAREEEWVRVGPPIAVARTYLARAGIGWRLPVLAGVVYAPTLRPDGSVLDRPGYDEQTGLLLDHQGLSFPPVPASPTQADAQSALALLDGLLDEFPFVGPVDRAVALSMILTSLVRRGLPTAPMHGLTAPTPGTGKSYLLDLATLISTGRKAAGAPWRRDDETENAKVLDSALLAGAPVLVLDNIEGELSGAKLAVILTQTELKVRPLGGSTEVTVQANQMVLANGNNLTVAADLTRRTLLCRLDAKMEQPEKRQFAAAPADLVMADRGRFVVAGLTVLRAYVLAGRPGLPRALGSYEAWSDLVRGALVWLGQADPVDSMGTARENDPRRNERLAVVSSWAEAFGADDVTTAQLIERSAQRSDLREALMDVAGAGGTINSRRLGRWLMAQRDVPTGGLTVRRAGLNRTGVAMWTLDGASPAARPEGSNVLEFERLLG
ncbi:hypothetical protein [Roseomonas sp. USHLN139]|uniref:hypothetical protein n=1 Tax=Roseomonas sp. USHLN139 TaxID=3081298 RepID=UPI003B02176E